MDDPSLINGLSKNDKNYNLTNIFNDLVFLFAPLSLIVYTGCFFTLGKFKVQKS